MRTLRGAEIQRPFPGIGAGRNFKGHLGGETLYFTHKESEAQRKKVLDIAKWL